MRPAPLPRLLCVASFAAALALASPAQAQRMPAPVDVQFSVLYRVLTYDRNLSRRTEDGLVIGIVFQSRSRQSVLAREAAGRQLPPTGAGFTVRFVALDLDAEADLAGAAAAAGCDVLYFAPLRAVDVRRLAAASRARGQLTATGVPEYVDQGIALAVGLAGDRPEIIVGLDAARDSGADLSAQLLRLATIR